MGEAKKTTLLKIIEDITKVSDGDGWKAFYLLITAYQEMARDCIVFKTMAKSLYDSHDTEKESFDHYEKETRMEIDLSLKTAKQQTESERDDG